MIKAIIRWINTQITTLNIRSTLYLMWKKSLSERDYVSTINSFNKLNKFITLLQVRTKL